MNVLVTGANGHVGYNLCRALVERGHAVRATIRSLADDAKAAPLRALGRVELAELDVRDGRGFEQVLRGAELLFHVAATYAYYTGSRDKDAALVRDSVEGAEAAMRAAAKCGVRKVVLTSSVVTVPFRRPGEAPSTESDWRTDLDVPYFRAKVEAERRAWQLADELGVRLVTVLPGAIGGPGFLRRTTTIDVFEGIMRGSMRAGAPNGNLPYVDIRDVVAGHILAAEREVEGRFALCNDTFPSFRELTRLMHEIDPRVPAAPLTLPDFMSGALPLFEWLNSRLLGAPRVLTPEFAAALKGKRWSVSNARAKAELGWQPLVPLRQSLAETMAAIRALRETERPRKTA